MKISFSITKLLAFIIRLMKWKHWKKRAKESEDARKLEDERNEAEDKIREEADKVVRPDKGDDDDLLNSGR